MATIGFVGLGNMGAPMAANLVKAGHRVTGYDVNAAAVQALASAGVQPAQSAAEATRDADVVITMLPAGEHVREVWLNQGGLIDAVKGRAPLLIDCSTIDVETARKVAGEAELQGFVFADAPVSRRRRGSSKPTSASAPSSSTRRITASRSASTGSSGTRARSTTRRSTSPAGSTRPEARWRPTRRRASAPRSGS